LEKFKEKNHCFLPKWESQWSSQNDRTKWFQKYDNGGTWQDVKQTINDKQQLF
jgi:hypothetical protein